MGKECIHCGEDNPDTATLCINCGAGLSDIIITETKPETETDTEQLIIKYVVICPICGTEYDVNDQNDRIDTCDNCYDEFDRMEIAQKAPNKIVFLPKKEEGARECCDDNSTAGTNLHLYEIQRDKLLVVTQDGGIIGRRGTIEPEFFQDDLYMGGLQCRIEYSGSQWRVENLGRTNPTEINGVFLAYNMLHVLNDGDCLKLADMYFRVSLVQDKGTASADIG